MKIPVSEKLYALAEKFPCPLYLVGGSVRDALAGLCGKNADADICAPAPPETLIGLLEEIGGAVIAVYAHTGTVKFSLGGEEYEYAAFRSDRYIRGEHSPAETYFTEDMTLDARRRDFKCNAVYYDILREQLCDPLGGIGDIEAKRVTTVAPAEKVFGEDGLRLMRLARQCAQTGFTPSGECLAGARENADKLRDIARERIYAELRMILNADRRYGKEGGQYRGLKILDESRVLDRIIPELTAGRGMEQNSAYHNYDVLEHSLRTVLYAHPSVRLAALLHDIGKPHCNTVSGNSFGHEVCGADIAAAVCKRLRIPHRDSSLAVRLTALHMYDVTHNTRESKVRRFIVRNYDIMEELYLLKQADYSACKDDTGTAPFIVKWRRIEEKMRAEGAPFTLKELNIKGDKLISCGVPPEKTGKVLDMLLMECVTDPRGNTPDRLIKSALRIAAKI